MENRLQRYFAKNTQGARSGIYSVCSAHPWVVQAAAEQAAADGSLLLVEATSNQVNQDGGYTGMRPADFRALVEEIAARAGVPREKLILGGDHLGPNPWRSLNSREAMKRAEAMVAEYAAAGFSKIHLDASMACADDPAVLSDETIAARAVQLAVASEASRSPGEAPVYVIGTEVPTPGGAVHALSTLEVTTAAAAEQTWRVHQETFKRQALEEVWQRVIALVVQPGVEFDHASVVGYDRKKVTDLKQWLVGRGEPLVFEAHSTDYQTASAYTALVEDGFGILKVGPALTFALREALFALEDIERELLPERDCSHLRQTLEQAMVAEPRYWEGHYHGSDAEQQLLRVYSYSDRMRYYWPVSAVAASVRKLVSNLERTAIPEMLVSRYLPVQYTRVREQQIANQPVALVIDKVRDVLRVYGAACQALRW